MILFTIVNNQKKVKKQHKTTGIKFPLLRLPVDLIKKTSFYLNEKDIFQFECCCRLFYQMINDTSYLNLSNNFKSFNITKKRLTQMSERQHSFYKYSKTKSFGVYCESGL